VSAVGTTEFPHRLANPGKHRLSARHLCQRTSAWRPRYIPVRTASLLIILLLGRGTGRFLRCRCQRQPRRSIQDVPLLRREVIVEVSRLQFPLASIWRHRAQSLNRIAHSPAALRRQTVELLPNSAQILLLRRRQMFPRLHTPQHLLLPFLRHAVEPLQPLFVLTLRFPRQSAECRVILQSLPALVWSHLPLPVQPLTGMMSLRRWLVRAILRPRSRLEIRARLLAIVRRIRRRTIVLRTRLAWLFPARLPILLPGLLHIRTRHVALLIVSVLRE
jgi:hypothetical protein